MANILSYLSQKVISIGGPSQPKSMKKIAVQNQDRKISEMGLQVLDAPRYHQVAIKGVESTSSDNQSIQTTQGYGLKVWVKAGLVVGTTAAVYAFVKALGYFPGRWRSHHRSQSDGAETARKMMYSHRQKTDVSSVVHQDQKAVDHRADNVLNQDLSRQEQSHSAFEELEIFELSDSEGMSAKETDGSCSQLLQALTVQNPPIPFQPINSGEEFRLNLVNHSIFPNTESDVFDGNEQRLTLHATLANGEKPSILKSVDFNNKKTGENISFPKSPVIDVITQVGSQALSTFLKFWNHNIPLSLPNLPSLLPMANGQPIANEAKIFLDTNEQDLPTALQKCTARIHSVQDSSVLKDLYHLQGVIYKKLGMFEKAGESFNLALIHLNKNSHSQESSFYELVLKEKKEIDNFIRDPENVTFRQHFLDEIGCNIPTHYEFLSMSALVYELYEFRHHMPQSLLSDEFTDKDQQLAKILASKGWEIESHSNRDDYFGVAFVNEKTGHLIVAHKGTKISSEKDLTDCLKIFRGKKPKQYEAASDFVHGLSIRYPKYEISHTGHSLGAVLAELLAYKRAEVAITAESPGIFNMISRKFVENTQHLSPITTYLSHPNIINTCNVHIGQQRTVTLKRNIGVVEVVQWAWETTKNWNYFDQTKWAELGEDLLELGEIISQDLESHKIHRILETFNTDRGYAPYQFIKKWPRGLQERVHFAECGNTCSLDSPNLFTHEEKERFHQLYQTEPASTTGINIKEFSLESRDLLINLRSMRQIPSCLSSRLLSLFDIEGDVVYTKSHEELFTVQDFHNYIEQQLVKNNKKGGELSDNPFYRCCELQPPKATGKNKNAEDAYQLFFSLPTIEQSSEIAKGRLKEFIAKDDRNNLEAFLKLVIGEDVKDKMNQDLKQTTDLDRRQRNPDVGSLLYHLFSSRSHLHFLSIMHKSAEFFIGNTLIINNDGALLFNQKISDFKLGCRELYFTLEENNQVVVRLGKECATPDSISYSIHQVRPFLNCLSELALGEEVELVLSHGHQIPEWIQEGVYQLLEHEESPLSKRIKMGKVGANVNYTVDILYDKKKIVKKVTFQSDEISSQSFVGTYQLQQFVKARYVTKGSISLANRDPNEVILIQETFNDFREETIKKIDHLKKKLVEKIKKDNQYLEDAIQHMIEQRFTSITDQSLISGERTLQFQLILKSLQKLSKEIGAEVSRKDFLQEAILEANYQKFATFSGKDIGVVSEAMKLFTQSYEYTQKIIGKDLIFVMGKTGSGKSTTIAALLQCSLKETTNSVGQQVYELDPEVQEGCPKIGHSLTSSETLYSQGYPVPGHNSLLLTDTPGLGENRGQHFALCAALSIDQAIHHSSSIQSLVVTVPLSSFMLDKGNGVVDLMTELHQFFPEILEAKSDSVHILVSKHNNYSNKKLEALLTEFLKDEASEDRRLIWKSLWKMFKRGQMEITPIDAQYPLRQLLSKWTSSRGFNSNQFAMQMQTNQIKHQFADHIQAAASTWDHDIFKRYLNFLSDEISNNKKIEEYERQKMAAEAQIKSIEERLRTIKLKESEEAIGLRSSKTTTTSPFSSGDESAAESKLDEVKPIPCEENFEVRHSEAYQTCLESAEYIRKNEEKVQGVIDSLTLRMKKVEKKIEKLTRKIQEHATGVETERIVNIAYHPGQVVSFCTLKRGARSRAHLEGRETNENDCVNEKVDQTMIAGEYEGEMTHDIEISKDFYLVPADRDQQKIFEEHGLVQTSDGQYRAILDGEHYELDLTRRVNPSGKHITYYFKTSWKKGASLPWIAGDHEIPKIVYYEVSLADWHKRRSNLEKEKESVMDSIQKSREELIFYENLTSSHKEQCMENLITSLKDQMETFSQSIRKLEKSQSETIKENARLVKERKMVAVIIKTRWTTAKALDWLTKLVVEIETKRRFDSRMGLGGNLLSTCQSYQDLLMERQRDLLSSCQKDLGQECGTVEEETGLDNQSPEKVQ